MKLRKISDVEYEAVIKGRKDEKIETCLDYVSAQISIIREFKLRKLTESKISFVDLYKTMEKNHQIFIKHMNELMKGKEQKNMGVDTHGKKRTSKKQTGKNVQAGKRKDKRVGKHEQRRQKI